MKWSLFLVSLALASVAWAKDSGSQWPQVNAKSAIVIDAETGKVLWSKLPDTTRYPASTTKIMTSLLVLESRQQIPLVRAPLDIGKIGGSSLHLKPGESIGVEDAVYAMMLRSANDVCYVVAQQIGGSQAGFARLMNQRAKEIGCVRTVFRNPNGLPDKQHVTTARDLALMAREAMRNDVFREIVRTQQRWIERSINQQDRLLVNRNKWLFKDSTADGIKTGYTNDAGHTYVGSAVRNGYRVITVVLGSSSWQDDHKALLDWSFSRYDLGLKRGAGEVIGTLPVDGGTMPDVRVVAGRPVQMLQRLDATSPLSLEWDRRELPRAPIVAGQDLGLAILRDADGFMIKVPIRAEGAVDRAPSILNSTFRNPTWYIVAGAMLCGAWVMRRRQRTA